MNTAMPFEFRKYCGCQNTNGKLQYFYKNNYMQLKNKTRRKSL